MTIAAKTVLITGADGFIGKNLQLYLAERKDMQVKTFTRDHASTQLPEFLRDVDFVFHLAGINRSQDPREFIIGNVSLTEALCNALAQLSASSGKKVPVVYASSIQAVQDNSYGQSKREAEDALFALQRNHGVPVHVFRLPNVFGKWCKPNYNSVVATFCHNIARGLPIAVNDARTLLTLVYVDDVVQRFVEVLDGVDNGVNTNGFSSVTPQYRATVGTLAEKIQMFRDGRDSLLTERVGAGLLRALYATYVSYLPVEEFTYNVPQYYDARGVFVEMLKTPDCGQFSYFTAYPGVSRGGHYHHSKTEKFLVIKGKALFKFRHMHTGQRYELVTQGNNAQVVETVPGWTHDITNIGKDELVVMLWANEIFDRAKPDTFTCSL